MRVQITPHKDKQGFFTVTPHGSIDTDTHEDFRSHLKDILAPSTRGILIDLKNVDYISSAGLGVLFFAKKFLTENGGELVFCHPKP
ncbi:MAG: STAS domain-containing protein, partial [Candidatus Omnitrophica bacterium]|nr:STAS domain-containing protein [Candidatus Omnitrophota bacterium]